MSAVTGTRRLTAFALRIDRRRSALWVAAMATFVVTVGLAFNRLYPSLESRRSLLELANVPVFRAILGPLLDPSTTGGLVAWRMGAILTVILSLATTFLVVARTRGDELHTRGQLVEAAPIGRGARTLAALLDAAALDAAAALAIFVALQCFNQSPPDALCFGAAVGLAAWCFGGIAALAAQLATTSKGANGICAALVAGAFLLRAVAQMSWAWLEWLSPMGWVGRLSPFARLDPMVLWVPLLAGLAVSAGAVALAAGRESGAGLLRARPSRSHALRGAPLALAWRLERLGIAITLPAATAYAVLAGSIVGLFNHYLEQSPAFRDAIERFGGTPVLKDAFTSMMAIYGGVAMGAWAVALVLRLHAEEERGRVQLLAATGATRGAILDGFCAPAALAASVGTLLWGLGLGVGRLLADHEPASLVRGLEAGAVAVPPTLVLVAFAVVAVGALRRAAPFAWAAVVWCAMVSVLGAFLGLSHWVLDLSPFTHISPIPLSGSWWVRSVALVALAAVLAAAGRAAFGRRSLGGS